jgi:hypothetical protein
MVILVEPESSEENAFKIIKIDEKEKNNILFVASSVSYLE